MAWHVALALNSAPNEYNWSKPDWSKDPNDSQQTAETHSRGRGGGVVPEKEKLAEIKTGIWLARGAELPSTNKTRKCKNLRTIVKTQESLAFFATIVLYSSYRDAYE